MQVRLTPSEHQFVAEAATQLGVSLNWIIRQSVLCRQAMDQEESPTPPHGGTEVTRVVVTPSEGVGSVSAARFDGFPDYSESAQKEVAVAAPVAVRVQSPAERMLAVSPFTEEESEVLAPCEARVLFEMPGYEVLRSEEVVIRLASGFEARGQATGQTDGWIQVRPGQGVGEWPEGGRNAQNIAAPLAACVWPGRMDSGYENSNQEEIND
jgi:hypothetical protein